MPYQVVKMGGTPVPEPAGWQTVNISWFTFKTPGDVLKGILQSKGETFVGMNKSKVGKYYVKADNLIYGFIGSTQLDEALRRVAVGSEVLITYTHDQETENKFPLKMFDVKFRTPVK
jgi:hypothetical protein